MTWEIWLTDLWPHYGDEDPIAEKQWRDELWGWDEWEEEEEEL